MSDTARLKLPLMAAGQAQKHVTHNEALEVLDALAHIGVASATVTAPPTPVEGTLYLLPSGATGAWAGHAGELARADGSGWVFHAPQTGWVVTVEDSARLMVRVGSSWMDLADFAWLLRAAGSAQARINKNAPGDTASVIFQTAFSGRAEFGLAGEDDFSVKVSPDGSTWIQAFKVERATGRVFFDRGAERVEVQGFTTTGTWTKPAWARQVSVLLVGAGGGGGSGRRGATGTERRGGGGGGAGGIASITYLADELPATLTVEVGEGGAGGGARTTNDTNGANGMNGGNTLLLDGGVRLIGAGGGNGGGGGAIGTSLVGWGGFGTGYGSNSGAAATVGAGIVGGEYTLGNGPGGGGGGGGLTTTNATAPGGRGGNGNVTGAAGPRVAPGGAGGAVGLGGNGGSAKGWDRGPGGGGGGGGTGDSAGTASGGAGGAGGAPGGGGGGGGGSTNGADSGAGGAGARGEAWIIAFG